MAIKLNKKDFFEIFKGVIFSLIISVLTVIVFAIIVKFANLSSKTVEIVNIALKIISILVGTLLAVGSGRQGLSSRNVPRPQRPRYCCGRQTGADA